MCRRRLAAPFASIPGSVASLASPRDHRAPTPAGRRESIASLTASIDGRRPDAVGVALARVARLAVGRSHHQAGDPGRMASERISMVLDVEEPIPHRAPRCPARRARPDSPAVHGQSTLGCAADSWRAAEVGDLRKSVDRRQVRATASAPALTQLADLPRQPREPDCGRGPLGGADGHLPVAVRPRDSRA